MTNKFKINTVWNDEFVRTRELRYFFEAATDEESFDEEFCSFVNDEMNPSLILSIAEAEPSAKSVLNRGLSNGRLFTEMAHTKTDPRTEIPPK